MPGFEIRLRGLGKVFLSNMPRVFVVSDVRTKFDRVIDILPKHAREQDTRYPSTVTYLSVELGAKYG